MARKRSAAKGRKGKSQVPPEALPTDLSFAQRCHNHHGSHYAETLINPRVEGPALRLADGVTARAQSIHSFAKGVFTIGTAGSGFVSLDLSKPCGDYATPNEAVAFSTATFAGTGFSTAPIPGVSMLNHNSDKSASIVGARNAEWILVSATLRVEYTGTALANKGRVLAIQAPSDTELAGYTLPQCSAFDNSRVVNLRSFGPGRQLGVFAVAYDLPRGGNSHQGFSSYSTTSNSTGPHLPSLGVIADGCNPGESFQFWADVRYQWTGSLIRGKKRTVADPACAIHCAQALCPEGTSVFFGSASKIASHARKGWMHKAWERGQSLVAHLQRPPPWATEAYSLFKQAMAILTA
jgi:hypothetical protein